MPPLDPLIMTVTFRGKPAGNDLSCLGSTAIQTSRADDNGRNLPPFRIGFRPSYRSVLIDPPITAIAWRPVSLATKRSSFPTFNSQCWGVASDAFASFRARIESLGAIACAGGGLGARIGTCPVPVVAPKITAAIATTIFGRVIFVFSWRLTILEVNLKNP